MQISRHYLTVPAPGGAQRVHYRRCGSGPVLLMLHQSPRSSVEYIPLMREWGRHYTCIAPDLPGFGQSQPLGIAEPDIGDFAGAILAFYAAAGLGQVAAYGFHSGAIILMHCLAREPERFRVMALGGHATFSAAEKVRLGDAYIPPNPPRPFGEHLVWLWNRLLEQGWYFPWFEPSDAGRLPFAHSDPAALHLLVLDLLASADHYRHGYRAVIASPSAVPGSKANVPPVLLSAYRGDPLAEHLKTLGELPQGWRAEAEATPDEHRQACFAFLQAHRAEAGQVTVGEDRDAGFVRIETAGFSGLIHWQGSGNILRCHAPARSLEVLPAASGIAVDLPGHGLSDPWPGAPPADWAAWQAVIDALAAHFGTTSVAHEPLPEGEPGRLYPDLTPDRFGAYLIAAWGVLRAGKAFSPWYMADKDHTRPIDPASYDLTRMAREHRAMIYCSAARELHLARRQGGID
jgi:haloalkane dehalogenase